MHLNWVAKKVRAVDLVNRCWKMKPPAVLVPKVVPWKKGPAAVPANRCLRMKPPAVRVPKAAPWKKGLVVDLARADQTI